MHPELFTIPFTEDVTLKSYGLMMVIGFLAAVYIIRRLSRNITPDPQLITNAALYSLITGVVGSRLLFVVLNFDHFRGNLLSVFVIWKGGLVLYGGVVLAIAVIASYLWYHKLPIRKYLDILAIGLLLALAFGRIGCFLNGCCFGKPTNLPWGVRFPYHHPQLVHSPAYESQVYPNQGRNRPNPQLKLPPEFFNNGVLKPFENLTEEQKFQVTKGQYRCLAVHPTQIYSSINAAFICLLLYLFWRRSQKAENSSGKRKLFTKPGSTFGLMFLLYGIARFNIEFLRDDTPFEYKWWTIYKGGTIAQNISIIMVIFGITLMMIFAKMKSDNVARASSP